MKTASSRGADDHAEKIALVASQRTNLDLSQATVYTTLEPCTHHARRVKGDSCTERLINAHVQKVCIGILDPNQDICGRGVLALQEAGIEVAFFPHEKVKAIRFSNQDFIRAQQNLGMTLTEPLGSAQKVKRGKHVIRGEYINLPLPGEVQVQR